MYCRSFPLRCRVSSVAKPSFRVWEKLQFAMRSRLFVDLERLSDCLTRHVLWLNLPRIVFLLYFVSKAKPQKGRRADLQGGKIRVISVVRN